MSCQNSPMGFKRGSAGKPERGIITDYAALCGVCQFDWRYFSSLKRQALIFDKFCTSSMGFEIFSFLDGPIPDSIKADIDYLRSINVLVDSLSIMLSKPENLAYSASEAPRDLVIESRCNALQDEIYQSLDNIFTAVRQMDKTEKKMAAARIGAGSYDLAIRQLSTCLGNYKDELGDVVPVCRDELPEYVNNSGSPVNPCSTVLGVTLGSFPVPDESCSWQDIVDFKNENRDKLWDFRRFINVLATKNQTEAEISDDIEWTLNEYTKAMKIHHLKAGNSFMEVYVMPVIELAEDLAKFNWSKIAKGALSVKKRQIELMEAEMKAPGRECAYVFEAQKRFGSRV